MYMAQKSANTPRFASNRFYVKMVNHTSDPINDCNRNDRYEERHMER